MASSLRPTYETLYDSVIRVLTVRANLTSPFGTFAYDTFIQEVEKDLKKIATTSGLAGGGIRVEFTDLVLHTQDKGQIRFVLWQLIVNGVIIPGGATDQRNSYTGHLDEHNMPRFTLTQFGIDSLKSGRVQPFDPSGYGARIQLLSHVPNEAKQFAQEAVSCFHRGEFLASLTTVGIANEFTFHALYLAIRDALTDPQAKAKLAGDETKSAKTRYETLHKILQQKRASIADKNIFEKLDSDVANMWNVIRMTRNDMMHPVGPKDNDRATVLAHLAMFTTVATHIDAAIEYFRKHPIA